ncbi:MAG: alkaline phosphatase D family protein [Nocardioides sp.]|nr:alkaline phosphatase D family protein [Nocardioides sp.]
MTDQTPLATRRTVLQGTLAGAAATGTLAVGPGMVAGPAEARSRFFRHGVASGDPRPRRVVLWTRVTPNAAATPGSGKGPRVKVVWQVARDARFRKVVARGTVRTGPKRDHTVKLDARGLRPGTDYYYRFLFRGQSSPVGRTRTAPAPGSSPDNLRFAVVSCSNLEAGFFSSYRHLARRNDLDAVIHLGDYLYEYGNGYYAMGFNNEVVRPHDPPTEMLSLSDYRRRHAQYKTDPDLQALHARVPFIVTWDDHEITNDAWAEGAENHQPDEGSFLARRRRAYRAYDEWMPVRMGRTAKVGDGTRLFRSLRFGTLAEISMLDLRTYRSQQSDMVPMPVPNPDASHSDPDRTITGDAQMRWLKNILGLDRTQWKLIGNPVMITPVVFPPLPTEITDPLVDMTGLLPKDGAPYNADQWDGYTADRRELFSFLADRGIRDTVFLTGDIHSAWACDLPVDAGAYPLTRTVGTEMVCTSVTSNNLKDYSDSPPRTSSLAIEAGIMTMNRHVKYLDFDSHGYSVLDVTPERTQMDYYVISARDDRAATVRWSAGYATKAGTQRVRPASGPATTRRKASR